MMPTPHASLVSPDLPRPHRLGDFLHALRDRLCPEDFGLPPGVRRRTPGLRREEAALLCGISPTWYTWIEQGRSTAISADTLVAIARGLRLSRAERAYLFDLAARADPAPGVEPESDPHQLACLVNVIRSAAYVLDRHWDAVVWNAAAEDLFSSWLTRVPTPSAEGERRVEEPHNLLRYVFLHPAAATFIVDWQERAWRLVAEYRADSAGCRNDPVNLALEDELSTESPTFKLAWHSQQVLAREGGLRSFQHPLHGRCDYRQFTLRVALHADLKLVVLVETENS